MLDKSRIIREDTPPIGSKIAQETLAEYDLCNARDSFWFYRQVMNPRFTLKGCWFPRTMARELRRFYDSWARRQASSAAVVDDRHDFALDFRRKFAHYCPAPAQRSQSRHRECSQTAVGAMLQHLSRRRAARLTADIFPTRSARSTCARAPLPPGFVQPMADRSCCSSASDARAYRPVPPSRNHRGV